MQKMRFSYIFMEGNCYVSRLKRITAGLTALVLSLSLTACGTNTRTALTVDGQEVPAGVYIYYLNTADSNAVSQLSRKIPNWIPPI